MEWWNLQDQSHYRTIVLSTYWKTGLQTNEKKPPRKSRISNTAACFFRTADRVFRHAHCVGMHLSISLSSMRTYTLILSRRTPKFLAPYNSGCLSHRQRAFRFGAPPDGGGAAFIYPAKPYLSFRQSCGASRAVDATQLMGHCGCIFK